MKQKIDILQGYLQIGDWLGNDRFSKSYPKILFINGDMHNPSFYQTARET